MPCNPDTLTQYMIRARKLAGVTDLRIHDGRHEGTTKLAEKLQNVLELSAVTGHKDLKSLKRYFNPRAAEMARKLG